MARRPSPQLSSRTACCQRHGRVSLLLVAPGPCWSCLPLAHAAQRCKHNLFQLDAEWSEPDNQTTRQRSWNVLKLSPQNLQQLGCQQTFHGDGSWRGRGRCDLLQALAVYTRDIKVIITRLQTHHITQLRHLRLTGRAVGDGPPIARAPRTDTPRRSLWADAVICTTVGAIAEGVSLSALGG